MDQVVASAIVQWFLTKHFCLVLSCYVQYTLIYLLRIYERSEFLQLFGNFYLTQWKRRPSGQSGHCRWSSWLWSAMNCYTFVVFRWLRRCLVSVTRIYQSLAALFIYLKVLFTVSVYNCVCVYSRVSFFRFLDIIICNSQSIYSFGVWCLYCFSFQSFFRRFHY